MRRVLLVIGILLFVVGFSALLQTSMVERYRLCPGGRPVEITVPPESNYSRRFGISGPKTIVEIEVVVQQRMIVKIRSRGKSIFKRMVGPGDHSWNVTLGDVEGRYSLVIGNPNRSRLSLLLHLKFYVSSLEEERPYVDAAFITLISGLSAVVLGSVTSSSKALPFIDVLFFLGTSLFLHLVGFAFRAPLFFLSSLAVLILANIFSLILIFRWARSVQGVLSCMNTSFIIGLYLSIQVLTALFFIPLYVGRTNLVTERTVESEIIEANPVFGVCDHLEPGTDEDIIRNHFRLIRSLGAKWVRLDMAWEQIEPIQDTWEFKLWDSIMRISSHYGLQVLPVISKTPRWASSRPDLDSYSVYPPRYLGDFRDFIRKVVERYGRRIYYWEIWNEPDAQYWRGSAQEYYRLLQEVRSVFEVVDPTAKIVLGGISCYGLSFLKELLSLGALDVIDIIGIHLYGGDADEALEKLKVFLRVLDEEKDAKPLWITEIGSSTTLWYGAEELQAKFLERTFPTLLLASRVQRIFWYELKDSGLIFLWAEHNFGLVRFDLTPKASYQAYRRMARTLNPDDSSQIRKT